LLGPSQESFKVVVVTAIFLSVFSGGNTIASAALIQYAVVQGGANLRVNSLDLNGQINLQDSGSSIVIQPNGQLRVSGESQITFINDNVVTIQQGASVSQGSPLTIVRASPTGNAPSVNNNGAWTLSSTLKSLGVSLTGTGAFGLSSTGAVDFTNANFLASSLASQGSFKMQSGNFVIGIITGSGTFTGQPGTFNSTSIAATSFSLADGLVNWQKANIQQTTIQNGVISVSSGTLSTLNFQGGTVQGLGTAQSTLQVVNLVVTTPPAKTLKNIAVTTTTLKLSCDGPSNQCALLTINAVLATN